MLVTSRRLSDWLNSHVTEDESTLHNDSQDIVFMIYVIAVIDYIFVVGYQTCILCCPRPFTKRRQSGILWDVCRAEKYSVTL